MCDEMVERESVRESRENELHMRREGPCPVETELKECFDKIKKRNIPKTRKLVKWEELRRGHLLKQVSLLEVEGNDVQHGHITCAFDKDGVTKCTCCGRTSLKGNFPRFCRDTCTRSNRGLNKTELLNQAMDEETWYKERGKHRQQRGIQEFVLRTSTQAAVPMEKRGEDRREAAKSMQKVREKMSERMRRADEGKTAKLIWDLLGRGQEKIVKVRHADREHEGSDCWEVGVWSCVLCHDYGCEWNM